jgi:hypothetical protein
MEKKFLNKEELENLRQLENEYVELINSLGTIEYQIVLLQKGKENIKQNISTYEDKLKEFEKVLVEKYGADGKFNLEEGTFTS